MSHRETMLPADPTPTPREVLAHAYCFSVHTRPGAPLDYSNELRPIGRACDECLRCADEALAALAASEPLTAERCNVFKQTALALRSICSPDDIDGLGADAIDELLGAHAALTAERDKLRKAVKDGFYEGFALGVWSAADNPRPVDLEADREWNASETKAALAAPTEG